MFLEGAASIPGDIYFLQLEVLSEMPPSFILCCHCQQNSPMLSLTGLAVLIRTL